MSTRAQNETTRAVYDRLEKAGYRGKIVSIEHLRELETEITMRRRSGLLDPGLYSAYLASFDFTAHQRLRQARSLIIVSAPQPQVRVAFFREDKPYPVINPPTYDSATDRHAANLLKAVLGPQGYRLKNVRLPEKLLAVRCGLAKYGKNNITYIQGMGSFHRPVVFISNFPCAEDSWGNPAVLEQCKACSACLKACPTGAVGSDRFQLYAERCITLF